jgi:hypothetical protein
MNVVIKIMRDKKIDDSGSEQYMRENKGCIATSIIPVIFNRYGSTFIKYYWWRCWYLAMHASTTCNYGTIIIYYKAITVTILRCN